MTRRTFEGAAAFYRALQRGPDGEAHNPFFYVSSSPWNLYDFLISFLEKNNLPDGPLFLRDIGLSRNQVGGGRHESHKLEQIKKVMHTYPSLAFVLVGDSGQKDPEIYRQAIETYPGRVRAVYIRDVSAGSRDKEVERLAAKVSEQDVDLVLGEHTDVFAAHAQTIGLVAAEAEQEVHAAEARES
jgi:phosphatidate phosphatase APP1